MKPEPGKAYAMMSRRASARPSTARIAPTPSRVQLVRVGAPAPRLGPTDARAVNAGGLLDERAEVDRRVAQGPSGPPDSPPPSSDAEPPPTVPALDRRSSVGDRAWPRVDGPARLHARPAGPHLRPLRVAGDGLPRGPDRDPLPGRGVHPCSGNACFQDVLPVVSSDGVPRGEHPVPAAAGGRSSCRSSRSGAGQPTASSSSRSSRAVDVGLCWWMLGRLPIRPRSRVGRDRVLRLRDGVLVLGPARDDVVPGPHPRGRARCCSRSASRSARTGTPRSTRTTCRTPTTPTSSRSAGARCRGPRRAGGLARLGLDRRQFLAGLLFGLACTTPAHDRVRRAVLPARRRRRLVAASRAVGGARGGDPDRRAARSTTSSRPGS